MDGISCDVYAGADDSILTQAQLAQKLGVSYHKGEPLGKRAKYAFTNGIETRYCTTSYPMELCEFCRKLTDQPGGKSQGFMEP